MEIILNNRELMLDGLGFLWSGGPRGRGHRPEIAQRFARAVYLRYFRDCSYNEIAQELQISTERARQIVAKGLREMRDYLNRKYSKNIALGA